jgi:hypothetical protein
MLPEELTRPTPYLLGAGELVSPLWKETDATVGWQYRFSIYRLTHSGGDVSRHFRPQDLLHLVRLCRLLAVTFVQDGWISADDRQLLQDLAAKLDALTNKQL